MTEHIHSDGGQTISQEQYRFLEHWLFEWELGKKMADLQVVKPALSLDSEPKLDTDTDKEKVKLGDILLLSQFVLPQAPRPVYLAVLSAWGSGRWLIAPYSAFSVPATTGELLTGRDDFPLKTLCLWNTLDVDEETLNQGWRIGTMSREELDESWAVFKKVATGAELSSELNHRIGPPILQSNDPRCEYQHWESNILRALQHSDLDAMLPKVQVLDCRKLFKLILEDNKEGKLAADDAERRVPLPSSSVPFDIGSQLAELTVSKSINRECVALVVSGDEQHRCSRVLSTTRQEIAALEDGEARIRRKELGDFFTIADTKGNDIVMIRVK